jgi:tRNA1(Val) A37 N6-methylase TrmN6
VLPPTTLDALLDEALLLEQPAPGHGYRFSADSVLLARFAVAALPRAGTLVDLGAGVGAVGLCVARFAHPARIVLVERDPVACELARRNVARAALACEAQVLEADVAEVGSGLRCPAADVVVANPPYTPPRAGRASPNEGRDAARRGEVEPFIEAAARLFAHPGSRACFAYPARSIVALLGAGRRTGLRASRLAFVHPAADVQARLALVEMGLADAIRSFAMEPAIVERAASLQPHPGCLPVLGG